MDNSNIRRGIHNGTERVNGTKSGIRVHIIVASSHFSISLLFYGYGYPHWIESMQNQYHNPSQVP